jgi:hypothetical protein
MAASAICARLLLLDLPEYLDRPAIYGEHAIDHADMPYLNDWHPALAACELGRTRRVTSRSDPMRGHHRQPRLPGLRPR